VEAAGVPKVRDGLAWRLRGRQREFASRRISSMQAEPRKPPNESIEVPADTGERANVESPPAASSDSGAAQAHTPRPHPPIEEPEDNPEEHPPETEPDSESDDSEQRRRPPRPGKTRG
jgi:hypothetical protein